MKKRILMLSFILGSGLASLSCVHEPTAINGIAVISDSDYRNLYDSKTKRTEVYSGLYNKLVLSATRLDKEMLEGILAKRLKAYQWDNETFQKQKTELMNTTLNKSQFFLSFYTPDRKYDNLSTKTSSWKVFIEVDGARYEGTATKIKMLQSDIEMIYPTHTRWATAYQLEFPVSLSMIENKPVALTITGSEGNATIKFDSTK